MSACGPSAAVKNALLTLACAAALWAQGSAQGVDTQISFLETVVELSRRHALSRIMYLAEKAA